MTLEDILHHGVRGAEDIVGGATRGPRRADGHGLVPESRGVPNPDRLVQGRRHHQVLLGVKMGAHHLANVCDTHRKKQLHGEQVRPDSQRLTDEFVGGAEATRGAPGIAMSFVGGADGFKEMI